MSVDPAGPISVPVALLADLVSESPTCRARFGVATAAELLALLHYGDVRATEAAPLSFPMVVVATGDQFRYEQIAGGAQNELQPTAGLVLLFADEDRHPESFRDSYLDFANWVGSTLAEIAALAAVDARLAMTEITTLQPPGLAEAETRPGVRLWDAIYLIQAT